MVALWLASAGCGAATGGTHAGAVRPTPVGHSGSGQVMPVATPVVRPLELTGAPRAPAASAATGTAAPSRLRIASIGVDAAFTRLGLASDGTIEVPGDPGEVGWYTNGPAPGDLGPAVALGHLDSAIGPAVFYRLGQLKPGGRIDVAREDGVTLRFAVQRVATYSVDAFPTAEVYGATAGPELRLITCGGQYSFARRRYLSNVVVYAALEQ